MLLEQNRQEGEEGVAERRARALVKGNRPAQRHLALSEVANTLKLAALTPDEQYRLARLHEAAGNRTAARN